MKFSHFFTADVIAVKGGDAEVKFESLQVFFLDVSDLPAPMMLHFEV